MLSHIQKQKSFCSLYDMYCCPIDYLLLLNFYLIFYLIFYCILDLIETGKEVYEASFYCSSVPVYVNSSCH